MVLFSCRFSIHDTSTEIFKGLRMTKIMKQNLIFVTGVLLFFLGAFVLAAIVIAGGGLLAKLSLMIYPI